MHNNTTMYLLGRTNTWQKQNTYIIFPFNIQHVQKKHPINVKHDKLLEKLRKNQSFLFVLTLKCEFQDSSSAVWQMNLQCWGKKVVKTSSISAPELNCICCSYLFSYLVCFIVHNVIVLTIKQCAIFQFNRSEVQFVALPAAELKKHASILHNKTLIVKDWTRFLKFSCISDWFS